MKGVVLLGMGPTALTALESLVTRFRVLAMVRDLLPDDPVVMRARALGVAAHHQVTVAGVERLVADLRPDCVVVSSYDRILPAGLLAACPFVNVHYAPLPQYRGRANVNWSLINGEAHAGISIHVIAPGLDAGNVLFQRLVPIGERDTVTDLYARLNQLQQEYLGETVERHLAGEAGIPQSEALATYGCSRNPDDGEIDWSQATSAIDRLIRALAAPSPGAFTYFEGKRLLVWKAQPVEGAPRYVGRVPGRVVNVVKGGGVDVLTGDGILRLLEVQLPGEEPVAASAVVRSVRASLGMRTADLVRRIEALERALARLVDSGPARPE